MKKSLLLLIAVMPAMVTGCLIYAYGVNVPFWDQWDCPGVVLLKAHEGTLGFGDLLAQHNESRMLFPKIIFLLLAKLTGWNIRYETLLTFMGACLVSLNIYILLKHTTTVAFHTRVFLLFLLNLLIFSPMQYMNFLWGMELVNFIPIISITTCLAIVYSNMGDAAKFILFSILATISTYSFANGLLCWIIMLPLLAIKTWKQRYDVKRLFLMGITISVFLLNVLIYFFDYAKPDHHPSFLAALLSPLKTALAFLTFMGAPLGEKEQIPSVIFGVILIGLFSAVCVHLFKMFRKGISIDLFLPWLALGIYSLLSGLMVSVGRMDFGVLASRYITFSAYLSVALIVIFVMFAASNGTIISRIRKHYRKTSVIIGATLLLILLLNYGSGAKRLARASWQWRYAKACLSFINVMNDGQCIKKSLYPIPELVRERANALEHAGFLGVKLMADPSLGKNQSFAENSKLEKYGVFESLTDDGHGFLVASGWAVLPEQKRAADAVILAYENAGGDEIAFAVAEVGERRESGNATVKRAYKRSGWKKQFPKGSLPENAGPITAWAFNTDTYEAFRLKGAF
ncbi:conserved hypothetical protein [delta proteobacterium NaphS2]|nr:conserved hypothetical protein [delta proteobacterium NaphS2]